MFESEGRARDWLGELNEQQRAAATAPSERPLLILAGAGSGKTMTLSARVAWLIAQGRAPERILLLTFTRRAARELLTRTRALLERAGITARGQGRPTRPSRLETACVPRHERGRSIGAAAGLRSLQGGATRLLGRADAGEPRALLESQ